MKLKKKKKLDGMNEERLTKIRKKILIGYGQRLQVVEIKETIKKRKAIVMKLRSEGKEFDGINNRKINLIENKPK